MKARIENHGSLVLVHAEDDLTTQWLSEHTNGSWFGRALVVEPRYVAMLVEGMQEEGIEVTA